MSTKTEMFDDLKVLSRGRYLQLVAQITLLDDAIIRSNEPEEVLSYHYSNGLGNRFIVPWRKVKGKLRRLVMEQQRGLGIAPECSLKDNLCMRCPSCLMFGGTGETSQTKAGYNLLSRVLGETFISTRPAGSANSYTANAVDEETLTTGQAFMTMLKVPAETAFLGVVTLKDPTPDLAAILVDNLERLTRLGASTREWGRCKTDLLGYTLGDRETLSAYDLAGKQTEDVLSELETMKTLRLPEAASSLKKVAKQVPDILPKEKGKK